MSSLKKVFSLWPFLTACVVVVLRVDLIVPIFRSRGIERVELFLCSCAIFSLSFLFWCWFWTMLGRRLDSLSDIKDKIKSKIEDDLNFSKKIADEVKNYGIWDQVKYYFINKYRWLTDPENPMVKKFKRKGYWAMFFFGFNPYGTRTIGIGISRAVKSKKALLAVYLGSIVYVGLVTAFWHNVFYIFST